ncbi:hypothetical protein C7N43_04765 [Sphingobacteriales bacterium UPWRP_1]|nr:hypothetical protein BVG80_07360 [Sphingobacteriales bacterium TSM_CSM]PSJ78246.1 hypothetical protein C7N43_04765 [Sphingobacteriales bacterium UPWRP_1]
MVYIYGINKALFGQGSSCKYNKIHFAIPNSYSYHKEFFVYPVKSKFGIVPNINCLRNYMNCPDLSGGT